MNKINLFIEKMKQTKLDQPVIDAFTHYYNLLREGKTGLIPEIDIEPPAPKNIIKYNQLDSSKTSNLEKLAVLKLNGGLGTSMGLKKAKSLLPVKKEYTFLDLIVLQIIKLRETYSQQIPLLFMNSFNTSKDTLDFLKKYPSLPHPDLPLEFRQNRFPKIKQTDYTPLNLTDDNLNWNPPGHGELYLAIYNSGILDQLIQLGIEYIFVSNSDNLGATVDPLILNYLVDNSIPFLMEVCPRTEMDKKGGHLAQTKKGQLILREVAQCPEEELAQFQNIKQYSYFNTNTLWIELKYLRKKIKENNGFLPLPLIVNRKTVKNIKVIQLESAMGAAISLFCGSKALVVDRSRFIPVKKTNDLLSIWSDTYEINENYELKLNNFYSKTPFVELDDKYYKNINQLQNHFPSGAPSLKYCRSLTIKGNIFWGKNVTVKGDTYLETRNKISISNKVLSGRIKY